MKPQDATERLRALCLAPEQTRWLVIEWHHGRLLVLRRDHFPWRTALFCFGLMGGLCYAISMSSPPAGIMVFACLFSVAMVTLFVISAVKGDRGPPLLDFETETGVLNIPRTGESFSTAGGLQLGTQSVEFVGFGGNDISFYGALHVLLQPGEGIPIGVESSPGHLRKQVRKFAAQAGLEVQELPPVILHE